MTDRMKILVTGGYGLVGMAIQSIQQNYNYDFIFVSHFLNYKHSLLSRIQIISLIRNFTTKRLPPPINTNSNIFHRLKHLLKVPTLFW